MKSEFIIDAVETLVNEWGEETADRVIRAIWGSTRKHIGVTDFLNSCTACGGNWGGMLLTGINELYPAVWDAIPDDMGLRPFIALGAVLTLLGIYDE